MSKEKEKLTKEKERLRDLKVPYLFGDNGLIRQGLSLKNYARIFSASDEDELNEVILEILDEEKRNGDQQKLNGGKK